MVWEIDLIQILNLLAKILEKTGRKDLKVLELIIEKNGPRRYLANISPKNTKSINFFKKNGFNLVQNTYEFLIDGKENEEN